MTPQPSPDNFYAAVYAKVGEIPPGAVASYSGVAKALGRPRGAQVVGWALKALRDYEKIPWQRVINAKRRISIVNLNAPAELQKKLLEDEGRTVTLRSDGWYVDGNDWFDFADSA